MLPTPTRHLQIQYQQIADASDPDQASAVPILENCRYFHIRNSPLYVSTNSIPANCRCFQPRPGIYKSKSSKLQMLPTPGQASANSIPASCRYFCPRPGICNSNSSKLQMLPTPTRHLQLQFQQIADTSNPDQASANPIPANCRYFRPRSGICKSNTSKLQMLPTLTRHLQVQYQQIADASDPDQASAYPIPANCRYFQPRPGICKSKSSKLQILPNPTRHLQIKFQLVADTSDPDQASTNPILANCRYFRSRPGICKSKSSKLQMLPIPG